jgi:hypothetical protein
MKKITYTFLFEPCVYRGAKERSAAGALTGAASAARSLLNIWKRSVVFVYILPMQCCASGPIRTFCFGRIRIRIGVVLDRIRILASEVTQHQQFGVNKCYNCCVDLNH